MKNCTYRFPLKKGAKLKEDNGYALLAGLTAIAPFLHGRESVQIAPIAGSRVSSGVLVTDTRSKLQVRGITREEAELLQKKTFHVSGEEVETGLFQEVKFAFFPCLASRLVIFRDVFSKEQFIEKVKEAARSGDVELGRRRVLTLKNNSMIGFSVVLKGAKEEDSLRIQAEGIGKFTSMGCGVFHHFRPNSTQLR